MGSFNACKVRSTGLQCHGVSHQPLTKWTLKSLSGRKWRSFIHTLGEWLTLERAHSSDIYSPTSRQRHSLLPNVRRMERPISASQHLSLHYLACTSTSVLSSGGSHHKTSCQIR